MNRIGLTGYLAANETVELAITSVRKREIRTADPKAVSNNSS